MGDVLENRLSDVHERGQACTTCIVCTTSLTTHCAYGINDGSNNRIDMSTIDFAQLVRRVRHRKNSRSRNAKLETFRDWALEALDQ